MPMLTMSLFRTILPLKPIFRTFCITAGFFISLQTASGQGIVVENLPRYEFDRLHFGFSLGVNSSNFVISPARLRDSILIVQSAPKYGFNLGIISEFAILRYLTVRFVPDL